MKTVLDWKKYAETARQMVAEGCVLLENKDAVLPLGEGCRVSVFGRMQFDYLKSGTGSGGLVNAPYVVNLLEGLNAKPQITINQTLLEEYKLWVEKHPFDRGKGWAQEPWAQVEMPLTAEQVCRAKEVSDVALVIIGRQAGEDRDNSNQEGSILLTQGERDMFAQIKTQFDKVVVLLNVGNIIDMRWVEEYQIAAVLYIWQGGCEGGNGVADLLVGDVNPSGKLTDTIAIDIDAYPSTKHFGDTKTNIYTEDIYVGYRYFETFAKEQVLYPFGYGLSYTSFSITANVIDVIGTTATISYTVKNTGNVAGKEVVQVYLNPPQGLLGKPIRNLVGFAKTQNLSPGQVENGTICVDLAQFASYDDAGVTGHPFCYLLEVGGYEFYVGSDVRSAKKVGSLMLDTLQVVQQLTQACAPVQAFDRMIPVLDGDRLVLGTQATPLRRADYQAFRHDDAMDTPAFTGDQGHRLIDVYQGKVNLDTFVAQLTDEEMVYMTRGEGMCSPKVTSGTAGAFGGVTDELLHYGIPVACCSDGPSGIRMDSGSMAFSLPNGAILAGSFNVPLNQVLYQFLGLELNHNKIDTILGPGLNIHRNPMNGRNFEYFSEDPYLTGMMAVSQLRAMQQYNVTGTIKHFACNSQEVARTEADSVLSERALREIYLKAFEMAVKQGASYSLMTSYGPVNGIWTASNYDLLTVILHDEWGFDGQVMTDWWAQMNDEGGAGSKQNTTAMIKAQNDVYMVTSCAKTNSMDDNSAEGLASGKISRKHLARSAKNTCKFLLKSPALRRANDCYELQVEEINRFPDLNLRCTQLPDVTPVDGFATVDCLSVDTSKGASVKFDILQTGTYDLQFVLNAQPVGVAQVPMTVYCGRHIMCTITLHQAYCTDVTETIRVSVDVNLPTYIKLFFSEGGLSVDRFTIQKVED